VRFLADMGVSYSVVLHLRNQAHDVVHLRDRDMQRLADDEIVALPAEEGRVILTFDLDFAELAFNRRQPLPSIVIYRLSDQRADRQIDRLTAALMVAQSALEDGAIVIVDDGRVRIRELPLR
jgi:predicted nuclease of predicted toxin-antitoxin system